MPCKYFSTACGLSFHFLNNVFQKEKQVVLSYYLNVLVLSQKQWEELKIWMNSCKAIYKLQMLNENVMKNEHFDSHNSLWLPAFPISWKFTPINHTYVIFPQYSHHWLFLIVNFLVPWLFDNGLFLFHISTTHSYGHTSNDVIRSFLLHVLLWPPSPVSLLIFSSTLLSMILQPS